MRERIWLIAEREIRLRTKSKYFWISIAIEVAFIVSIGEIGSLLGSHLSVIAIGPAATKVALTAKALAGHASSHVKIRHGTTLAAARAAVASGKVSAAIYGDGSQVISKGPLDATLQLLIAAGIQTLHHQQLHVTALATTGNAHVAAGVAVASLLVFGSIQTYGNWASYALIDEKTGRTSEVLLTRVSAAELMVGKVAGNLAASVVHFGLIVLLGVEIGEQVGGTNGVSVIVPALGCLIAFAVAGLLFTASIYTAVTAGVVKREELGTKTAPIAILYTLGYLLISNAISDPHSKLLAIAAYIPPFSIAAMPIRWAAGAASTIELLASLVILLVLGVGLTPYIARAYRRSLLGGALR